MKTHILTCMITIGFLWGCATAEYSGSAPKAKSSVPGMSTDVDFDSLSPEEQAKAVIYREGIEKADSPPWPIGGWESMSKKMRLPYAEADREAVGIIRYEFILSENGDVKDVTILESFRDDVDQLYSGALIFRKMAFYIDFVY